MSIFIEDHPVDFKEDVVNKALIEQCYRAAKADDSFSVFVNIASERSNVITNSHFLIDSKDFLRQLERMKRKEEPKKKFLGIF